VRDKRGGSAYGPTGIAVGPDGTIYVSEVWMNKNVARYTSDFAFLDATPSDPSGMESPVDVAVDADGNVYVCDFAFRRIHKFGSDLEQQWMWGTEGSDPLEFVDPSVIAVDAGGAIVVGDAGNDRIQRLH